MNLNKEILEYRAWAVPSLAAILLLHHDFNPPRHSVIKHLSWTDTAAVVRLEYGLRNVSGKVIDAATYLVTLDLDGTVQVSNLSSETRAATGDLTQFLAGEIARSSILMSRAYKEWLGRDPEWFEYGVAFSLASALIAYPLAAMEVEVDKDPANLANLRKVHLRGESLAVEITPAGTFGVNVFSKGVGELGEVHNIRVVEDLRLPQPHKESLYGFLLEVIS